MRLDRPRPTRLTFKLLALVAVWNKVARPFPVVQVRNLIVSIRLPFSIIKSGVDRAGVILLGKKSIEIEELISVTKGFDCLRNGCGSD